MELFATYAPLALGLVMASVVAGLLAGFLGVGGGIVLVPVMVWMFGFIQFPAELAMHMAVATSLATIIFTAVSSARAHHSKGYVLGPILKSWGPFVALSALAGGLLARYIDPDTLTLIFAVVAVLVSINFLRSSPLVIADQLPTRLSANAAIAGGIGLTSSLMGIGGGTLGVPVLSAYSVPVKKAVGTSAAMGLLIAGPAAIGFLVSGAGVAGRPPFSLGYVSVPAVLLIIPITMYLAPVGARLAHKVEPAWVKRGFAAFLALTAARMFVSVL
ncbi:membrane protein [Actibacterium mucosum KCTC 23349]|uniref:Probable membrane transporter protein n=1 Tax=Actibacterium mucosum KCTC 23349 TaxID=1454373 RepID=A0A037ZNF9_9RHOB|nr:sulfite exporter TauE/SafE family protein [Actibacterium mucosum]KAJ57190.1 membrane protein [Actibacterium mucosum KCTC 23349]